MRSWMILGILCVMLVACTNRQIVTTENVEPEALGEKYGFTMLQVSLDTKSMKDALVSRYEETSDAVEASYEHKIDGVYLHGNDAMKKLEEIFGELDIDPEMEDTDLLKAVSEAFGVKDYTRLKVQVTFRGYETKELMLMK